MTKGMKAQMVNDILKGKNCNEGGVTCYYDKEEGCSDCPQLTWEGVKEEEERREKVAFTPTRQTDFSGKAKYINGYCASEGHPITKCVDYIKA